MYPKDIDVSVHWIVYNLNFSKEIIYLVYVQLDACASNGGVCILLDI